MTSEQKSGSDPSQRSGAPRSASSISPAQAETDRINADAQLARDMSQPQSISSPNTAASLGSSQQSAKSDEQWMDELEEQLKLQSLGSSSGSARPSQPAPPELDAAVRALQQRWLCTFRLPLDIQAYVFSMSFRPAQRPLNPPGHIDEGADGVIDFCHLKTASGNERTVAVKWVGRGDVDALNTEAAILAFLAQQGLPGFLGSVALVFDDRPDDDRVAFINGRKRELKDRHKIGLMLPSLLNARTLGRFLMGVDGHNPTVGERVSVLHAVANAMHMLHSLKIFHGDLHDGNVLVLPGNRITLIDFGKSRVIKYSDVAEDGDQDLSADDDDDTSMEARDIRYFTEIVLDDSSLYVPLQQSTEGIYRSDGKKLQPAGHPAEIVQYHTFSAGLQTEAQLASVAERVLQAFRSEDSVHRPSSFKEVCSLFGGTSVGAVVELKSAGRVIGRQLVSSTNMMGAFCFSNGTAVPMVPPAGTRPATLPTAVLSWAIPRGPTDTDERATCLKCRQPVDLRQRCFMAWNPTPGFLHPTSACMSDATDIDGEFI